MLSERLDPSDRGKVDREALVTWLTSGFDPLQVSLRNVLLYEVRRGFFYLELVNHKVDVKLMVSS